RAPRSDLETAVHDPDFDAVAVRSDHVSGKALTPVIDGKTDTGFGRGISVADRGLGENLMQTVENGLVGDLTGEADIARRKPRSRTAHQQLAPVRGRTRHMRDRLFVQAGDVV